MPASKKRESLKGQRLRAKLESAEDLRQAFGVLLREARRRAKADVDDVAIACDRSRPTIYMWEQGTGEPRVSDLVALGRLYNMHPASLLMALPSRFLGLDYLEGPAVP